MVGVVELFVPDRVHTGDATTVLYNGRVVGLPWDRHSRVPVLAAVVLLVVSL